MQVSLDAERIRLEEVVRAEVTARRAADCGLADGLVAARADVTAATSIVGARTDQIAAELRGELDAVRGRATALEAGQAGLVAAQQRLQDCLTGLQQV